MSCFRDYFSEEEISELKINAFSFLKNDKTILNFLEEHWKENFKTFGLEKSAENAFYQIKTGNFQTNDEYLQIFKKQIQSPEYKKHRRKSFNSKSKMDFQYELIKKYLENKKTFFDFGSGKLALIRKISANNLEIKKLYGYDPGSSPRFISFDKRVEFFTDIKKIKKLKNIDLVYSSLVFHHLTTDEITKSLKEISICIKQNGEFILIEESFPDQDSKNLMLDSQNLLKNINFEINYRVLDLFNNLTVKQKYLSIYLNDYLINLGNLDYMPWTFEYKSISEWEKVVENHGFVLKEKYYLGIVKNKGIKQGITSILVFIKP